MKKDTSHIRHIRVVSNTHWDREFRRSFEKTRRRLLTMLDTTLDILEADPAYHSFTLDGHSILLDDYLELRPERRSQIERLMRAGRLIAGPYYTLPEEFSIGQEPLIRNLLWGRKTVEKYGGKVGTVAYTPSSWGQTGQLPQVLRQFGLTRVMFYRGISHHESDAEFIWAAPDGSRVLGSRFALFARYNWYYQVHRPVTVGRTFSKDYKWGERQEVPVRFADGRDGEDMPFDVKSPIALYDPARLQDSIQEMVEREGRHFTTPVFLAMHGHDLSVAHPLESKIIADAQKQMAGRFDIRHTSLECYWDEVESRLDKSALPVLTGERRAYLRQGMWTFLFPSTISARTYLKQQDFHATNALVGEAEPLATLASALGADYPSRYLERGWYYLLANHTHDANGGCAPDPVCADMEYRYRKVSDIAEIVMEDAVTHVARNLSPQGQSPDVMQLVVFNPLPVSRDAIVLVDLQTPREFGATSVLLESDAQTEVEHQPVSKEASSCFVDSIWDVPTILDSTRMRFYAHLKELPPLGYRRYTIRPAGGDQAESRPSTTRRNTMENRFLRIEVNDNGTINLECKATGRIYNLINYLSDQGEVGNAWRHRSPSKDRWYDTLGLAARVSVLESGPLVSSIEARYDFPVPRDGGDGTTRSTGLVPLPLRIIYRVERDTPWVEVDLTVDNRARDHWLRANFPTGLQTSFSWADTHFDVVSRPIALPDSRGWVEQPEGTHPLQNFAAVSDGVDLLALMSTGLFEYEVFDDKKRTLALTLLRACRIKLAVSEEKQTELADAGIQCPGPQRFRYAICAVEGNWERANLPGLAAQRRTPVRAVMTGRGAGTLPGEGSLFRLVGDVQLTAVKYAEKPERGVVIRLCNPTEEGRQVEVEFGVPITEVWACRADESDVERLPARGAGFTAQIGPKKIASFRVVL